MIVIGKSAKGGSTLRDAQVLELAVKDLEQKIEGNKVLALAVFDDSFCINILAYVEEKEPGKKDKKK